MGYLLPVCLAATLGGLLFGYDTGVISGAIEPLTAKFSLAPELKGWVSACVLLGCAGGVLAVGPISDRFGRRLAMMLAAIMFLVSAIGTALPESVTAFNLFASSAASASASHPSRHRCTSPRSCPARSADAWSR